MRGKSRLDMRGKSRRASSKSETPNHMNPNPEMLAALDEGAVAHPGAGRHRADELGRQQASAGHEPHVGSPSAVAPRQPPC